MAKSQTRVAYIGLGNMGAGMAKNIALKANLDSPVLLYNRTRSRSEQVIQTLPKDKASVVESIDEAVQGADVVFISMGSNEALLSTVEAVLKSDIKGKTIVDASTTGRETTAHVEQLVTKAGAGFVACPVFGAPLAANEGSLVCLPAGPAPTVEKVLPFCKTVMGREVIPFLDRPAATASAMKCIGNTLLFHMCEALAEGHVLAHKSGVGSDHFHRFVQLFFPPYIPYSERMMNGVYYQSEHPPFSVDHARKDIRFAMNLAEKFGVPLKGLQVTDEHYGEIQGHMDGKKADLTALYGIVRKESGLEFEA